MIDKNDWRLQGQEKYLKGATLYLKKYTKFSDAWDHDHCEFCWAKFGLEGLADDLDEGYATKDNDHWICKRCFDDFGDIFQWQKIQPLLDYALFTMGSHYPVDINRL